MPDLFRVLRLTGAFDPRAVSRLRACQPSLTITPDGVEVDLGDTSAEEVLGLCLVERIAVRSSEVIHRLESPSGGLTASTTPLGFGLAATIASS